MSIEPKDILVTALNNNFLITGSQFAIKDVIEVLDKADYAKQKLEREQRQ
jgi:hypothetical protein